MLSAKYFAQSTVPFEEVALKFVERDERDALRNYLLTKVDKLKKVVSFIQHVLGESERVRKTERERETVFSILSFGD